MPGASVLLPSYNYASTLPEALDSFLGQSYQDTELIAVDDASQDHSLEILERYARQFPNKIRIFRHEGFRHRGLAATYAEALNRAQSPLIAFLEADDVWARDNLAKKVDILTRHPHVGVVYSDYRPFGNPRGTFFWNLYRWSLKPQTPRERPFAMIRSLLRRNPVASFSHFATRRSLLTNLTAPKTKEIYYDWWVLAHLSLKTSFYYINEQLVRWRIHGRSANFGPLNLRELRQLQEFLLELYDSLRDATRDEHAQAMLADATMRILRYRRLLRDRKPLRTAAALAREPLSSSRFLAHVFLRNQLFR
ncbi:MAG: glycosyltransferase [Candidatus Omnitrophota bacterium]|nr:glycosyltransferase [Candidatus Omnitrophota bacterium]